MKIAGQMNALQLQKEKMSNALQSRGHQEGSLSSIKQREKTDEYCRPSRGSTVRMTRSMSRMEPPIETSSKTIAKIHKPTPLNPSTSNQLNSIVQASADLQNVRGLQCIQELSLPSNAPTVKKEDAHFEASDFDFNDFDYQVSLKEEEASQSNSLKQESSSPTKEKRKTKRGPQRKVRQTITKEKLRELNIYLSEFFEKRHQNKKPTLTLREIAIRLNLSYSTTLHKAGVFRRNKEVKPGKFLSSLTKKRKYKKSYECEQYIELALKARPFYSAESLAKYILRQFRVSYPRAIIGRHLNEMGYSSNNIKAFPLEKNGAKCIHLRKIYANILQPLLINPSLMVYVDEAAFSKNLFRVKTSYTPYEYDKQKRETEEDYVSVMVAMSSERIVYYHVRNGFYQKQDFIEAIGQIYNGCRSEIYKLHCSPMYLISDMHKIHFDKESISPSIHIPIKIEEQAQPSATVDSALLRYGMKRIFLPPGSPQLNPVEIMITYLKNMLFSEREEIVDCNILREKIIRSMREIAREPTKRFFYEFEKWFGKAKEGLPF